MFSHLALFRPPHSGVPVLDRLIAECREHPEIVLKEFCEGVILLHGGARGWDIGRLMPPIFKAIDVPVLVGSFTTEHSSDPTWLGAVFLSPAPAVGGYYALISRQGLPETGQLRYHSVSRCAALYTPVNNDDRTLRSDLLNAALSDRERRTIILRLPVYSTNMDISTPHSSF